MTVNKTPAVGSRWVNRMMAFEVTIKQIDTRGKVVWRPTHRPNYETPAVSVKQFHKEFKALDEKPKNNAPETEMGRAYADNSKALLKLILAVLVVFIVAVGV